VSPRLDVPAGGPDDTGAAQWSRVSPRYVIVDVVGTLIVGLVAVGVTSIPALVAHNLYLFAIPAAVAVALLIVLGFTPRRVRSIGYELRADDLLFRRGLMFQRFVSVPYGRMQLVDINRGPLARAVGLSELKFVTASASTGVTIPGLPAAVAEELRDRLVSLAESRRAGL
jgi:membrane protein YdbS with pleckstrin-like domain